MLGAQARLSINTNLVPRPPCSSLPLSPFPPLLNRIVSSSNKTWEDRQFSIVTAPTQELAISCGLFNPEESLFMSTATPDYFKGALDECMMRVCVHMLEFKGWRNAHPTPPDHTPHHADPKGEGDPILPLPTALGYLQRFMLASPGSKEEFKGAKGKAAVAASKACQAADAPKGQAKGKYSPTCYDPTWVRDAMKENAPSISYFLCDITKPEGQRLTPWGRPFKKADVTTAPQV